MFTATYDRREEGSKEIQLEIDKIRPIHLMEYNVASKSSIDSNFVTPLENMDKIVFMKTEKWKIIHPVWSLTNEWMDRQTDRQSEGMKAVGQGSQPKCWVSFLSLNFHGYMYNDQV